MSEWLSEDAADKIGLVSFCLLLLCYALFWVSLGLCFAKLVWWVLFVL